MGKYTALNDDLAALYSKGDIEGFVAGYSDDAVLRATDGVGQGHAGHERGPVVGVVPDRQALARRAQQDLLVGHQAAQAHGVDVDATRAVATPRPLDHFLLGGVRGPLV